MQKYKGLFLLLIIIILVGCNSFTNKKLTIEPYNMTEQEKLLISKTGVEQIEFFKLNGTIEENNDLQYTVELFKDGKFEKELLGSSGELETKFKENLVSFGISDFGIEDQSLKIIAGTTSGYASTSYPNYMTSSSFGQLLNEKITLEKNKPAYLVAWIGTTAERLRSIGSENGELPEVVKESEIALLYKILWTDQTDYEEK